MIVAPRYDEPTNNVPKILSGTVTARLAKKDGSEFPSDKKILMDVGGTLVKQLDENSTAEFSLKVIILIDYIYIYVSMDLIKSIPFCTNYIFLDFGNI